MRLRNLIQASSLYQVKFAEYLDYMGIEKRMVEMKRKYGELVKREHVEDKGQPVEDKQEPIEAKQAPVEIEQEAMEDQKPVEATQADNPVEVTQENKNAVE